MLEQLNTATSPALLSRINDTYSPQRVFARSLWVIDHGMFERWSERLDQANRNLTVGTEHVVQAR
jgi:hypothetical protein